MRSKYLLGVLFLFLRWHKLFFQVRSLRNCSYVFQVRHELASRVFTCCSFIIKHDYKVTIYLLPHILLYMLLGCTPAEQQEVRDATVSLALTEEVNPVLVWAVITHLLLGNGGDAGRADRGWWTRRGAMSGDGLQPVTAQHSDGVQHVVSPHTVEPPHSLLQSQTKRLVMHLTWTKTSSVEYYSKRSHAV